MKAAKSNVSCSNFQKVLTEAMSEEIAEMVDLRKSWDLKWRFQEGKVEKSNQRGKLHEYNASCCHWNMGNRNLCMIKQAEFLEK
ncbi:hypothetical protein T09_11605 [Trichinella sp. T9]|nr:hypothetical protein T09_11605 [Trichinella sp. T9]